MHSYNANVNKLHTVGSKNNNMCVLITKMKTTEDNVTMYI